MHKIDHLFQLLTEWKQKNYEDVKRLAEVKGRIIAVRQMKPNDSVLFAISNIAEALILEIEARKEDFLDMAEIMLLLTSAQAKEMDMLRGIVTSLASEKKELLNKIGEMEKWRKEREPILRHLDDYLRESREFFNANR